MCKYFYILFIKAYFDMKVILFLIAEMLDYWEKKKNNNYWTYHNKLWD